MKGKLSPREEEVLQRISQGETNPAIAAALWIAPNTVHTHVARILAKLEARNRAHAVSIALRTGVLDAPFSPLAFMAGDPDMDEVAS